MRIIICGFRVELFVAVKNAQKAHCNAGVALWHRF